MERFLSSNYFLRTIVWFWKAKVTPQAFARALPVRWFVPSLVRSYVRRRWQRGGELAVETIELLTRYNKGVLMLPGCSEQSLFLLLQPIAQTITPIGPVVEKELLRSLPVDFIYGEYDWMTPAHGVAVVERMTAAGRKNAAAYVLPSAVGKAFPARSRYSHPTQPE